MNRRVHVLVVSLLVPIALLACKRSEELGQLPDGAPGDDAHVDSGCGPSYCKPPGLPCASSDECISGFFCVTGVCCNTACSGSAMSCVVPGSVGTCTAVPDASTPQANGAVCKNASECASGFCVDGVCCNTACLPSMICFAPGSVGTCTDPNTTTPQALGTSCTTAAQCASGFCVDGVCCNTACAGSCMTCAATGAVGTCQPTTSCP